MKPIIIIPTRMNASRFPGKPLQLINDEPIIIKILNQAKVVNLAPVVVATPDQEIIELVRQHGGEAILTNDSCKTGTDRIAEAVNKLDPERQKYDVVINLQGDLAIFDNEVLITTYNALKENPDYDIATPCTVIAHHRLFHNPHTVKAVISFFNPQQGRALYFTRSTCPHGDGELYQHLGVYAYKREALDKFVKAPKSPLEIRENLEQLRALEIGLKIVVTKIKTLPVELNTPEDLELILQCLSAAKI